MQNIEKCIPNYSQLCESKNFAKICQRLQAEVDEKATNKLCEKKQTNTSTVGI